MRGSMIMGEGEKHHHHHHLSGHEKDAAAAAAAAAGEAKPPKGCMAIRVGVEGQEQQRFVVPVMYVNHPLFVRLLKEAEKEYGFAQKGAITIPCHVNYFRQVQGIIDSEKGGKGGGSSSTTHHHHYLPLSVCFRA